MRAAIAADAVFSAGSPNLRSYCREMLMRRVSILGLVMVASIAVLGSVVTPAGAQNLTSCTSRPAAIQACSRLLARRNLTAAQRELLLVTRGIWYRGLLDYDKALADFNEVIRGNTVYAEAYHERGRIMLDRKNFAQSFADLNKALALPPRPTTDGILFGSTDALIYKERAEANRGLGNIDAAIADYTEYAKRAPHRFSDTYGARAELYARKGDIERAIADYEEALSIEPGRSNYREERDRLHATLKSNQGAVSRQDGTAQRPSSVAGPVRKQDRSDCLESYGGGDSDTAIPACTRLLASPAIKHDERTRVLIMRGTWYLSASQADAAIADFREAAQQSPTRDALFGLAEAYRNKGDFDKAIAALSDYISSHRDDPDGYHNRANLHASKHEFDKAIADMTAKIRVGSRDHGDYILRASFWHSKGDLDRAIADYSEAIRISPRDQSAYELRARIHDEKGDMEKALADFRTALSLDPDTGKSMGIDKKIARIERDIASGFRSETKLVNADPASPDRPRALAPVTENRIALLIGNSAYRHNVALANPRADAQALAATLKRIGFKSVDLKFDLTREQLVEALRQFAADAAQADWAVVYFAGHGLQIGGINYLIPVDARLVSDRDVSFEAVAMEHVLNAVDGARRLRLAILDACRDNPFVKTMTRSLATRSLGRGLAAVEPQRSTLVAFAARDGQVALDGTGGNSPYVSALIRHLEAPGLEINLLFRKVRDDVLARTGNDQEPFTYGSLSSEALYFRPVAAAK
ncbi:MAG: caspase family protein [Pseudorhodoplanes sp.]